MNHIIVVSLHFVLLINVWRVIGEECKTLKVVQNYTISTEVNTSAVIIKEIDTTTAEQCSDACCNISQTDNCCATLFIQATGRCTFLQACQPVSSYLILPAVGQTLTFVGFPVISSYLNASDINISFTTSMLNQTLSIGTSPYSELSSSRQSSKSILTSTTSPPEDITSTTTSTTLSLPTTSLNPNILLSTTTQLTAANVNTDPTLSNLNQSLNTISMSLSKSQQIPFSTKLAEKTTLSTAFNLSTNTTAPMLFSLTSNSNALPSYTIKQTTSIANTNSTTSTTTAYLSSIMLSALISSLDYSTAPMTENSTSTMPPVILSSLQPVSTESPEVPYSQSPTNPVSSSLASKVITTTPQLQKLASSNTWTFGSTDGINTENVAEFVTKPAETSTKGLSGKNSQPKLYNIEAEEMSTELIAALSVGIVLTFAVMVVCGKKLFDGWQRRNYLKLDYLINGIYD